MFSNELAAKLMGLPKIIKGKAPLINLGNEKNRLILYSENEPEYEFLFEISSNKKISFRISLHNQENNTHEGLIRIDYKSGHVNPETVTDDVPDFVKPYAGYYFQNEAHVHIYVEGFKYLAWAVPLSIYDFPIQEINNSDDFAKAVAGFSKIINIISPFTTQTIV